MIIVNNLGIRLASWVIILGMVIAYGCGEDKHNQIFATNSPVTEDAAYLDEFIELNTEVSDKLNFRRYSKKDLIETDIDPREFQDQRQDQEDFKSGGCTRADWKAECGDWRKWVEENGDILDWMRECGDFIKWRTKCFAELPNNDSPNANDENNMISNELCDKVVTIDFEEDSQGNNLLAGTKIKNQYKEIGIRIRALSNRNKRKTAILFDTAHPTGGNDDFKTPGWGTNNKIAQDKVLIIAASTKDRNHDGLVDNPGGQHRGGQLHFKFDFTVLFQSITILDIVSRDNSYIKIHKDKTYFKGLGNNSSQTLTFENIETRVVKVSFSSLAAVASFTYCIPKQN